MQYYVYEKPRFSKRQHIIITLVVCLVVIVTTCLIVTNIINQQVDNLKNEIVAKDQKIAFYTSYKDQYESVKHKEVLINQYQNDLQNKDKQIEMKEKQIQDLSNVKDELSYQNAAMENTIKKFSSFGVTPKNYNFAEPVSRGGDRLRGKLEYVGEWKGTFYSPNKKECGNDKGITASGNPVIPGKTIAIDPKYWKLGTKFYIEGYGEVIANDTGTGVNGRNRFDFCVLSTDISKHAGVINAKVYLIKE